MTSNFFLMRDQGLGFQTTLNLASRGCKIIMADINDMEETKQQIINITNNSNIITKYVDLSSFKSVRDFATDIHATVKELHILVNNGGIGVSSENKTIDGYNPVMQINYFSHFLLTHLLIGTYNNLVYPNKYSYSVTLELLHSKEIIFWQSGRLSSRMKL